MQSRTERANPLDNFAKKARAAFEGAAVASHPRMSAEKLMAEITVAMLDVHEIETQLPSQTSRPMEVFDDRFDFTVAEQRIVGGQFQAPVQQRMVVEDAWLGASMFVRAAVPTGVRQLQ